MADTIPEINRKEDSIQRFVSDLRETYRKNETKRSKFVPLEKIVEVVSTLVKPTNSKIATSAVGFALIPEALISLTETYAPPVLTSFYDRNKDLFTPSPETFAVITKRLSAVQTECEIFLHQAPSFVGRGIDFAVSGLPESIGKMFGSTLQYLSTLSPAEITAVCTDSTKLQQFGITTEYIIPDITRTIINELDTGFTAARTAGIFMLGYAVFKDKIAAAMTREEAGKSERITVDVVSNLMLAFSTSLANATLTYIHTGGPILETMLNTVDTPLLCMALMSCTRLLTMDFKDDKNRELTEFVVGGVTLLTIAGVNVLTVAKFLTGLFV